MILLFVKGDWAEYAHTFGFVSWANASHPCLFCHCSHADMYEVGGLSVCSTPWGDRDMSSYDAACQACERTIIVTEQATLDMIVAALEFAGGRRGRGFQLAHDLPSLGLCRRDRLEPS
eukprot:4156886-Alexandrium_andersonii.AAC.1